MVEYARCIYSNWSQGRTAEDCREHWSDYVEIVSHWMKRTPEEVNRLLARERWRPLGADYDSQRARAPTDGAMDHKRTGIN